MTTTTTWHCILTLGTYPDGDSGPLRLRTFTGTLIVPTGTGRSAIYQQLRDSITADHPEQADAVVVHSDIQPNGEEG